MANPRKKPPDEKAVITGVSFDPQVLKLAKARADSLGFRFSFSAYIGHLLLRDLNGKGKTKAA